MTARQFTSSDPASPRRMRACAAAVVAMVVLTGGSGAAAAQERVVPESEVQIQYSFAPLVRKVAPAVVNVFTRTLVRSVERSPLFNDPLFRRFFGDDFFGPSPPRQRMQSSLGSGVIIRADGLVVTNNHVIAGSDEIIVALADRREFPADIVLADERTDLAVLRIDTAGEALPALEFMDSDDLEVGDLVLAIGNPFGVGQTVTSGIISALARTQVGITDFQFFIQTDAAINPGNSGGALVTMDGRLAGVNTAIFSRSGGSIGIGFAIPSNMAASVVASATTTGRVQRPWLGAGGQEVDSDLAGSLGLERPGGVLINKIYPGGPAERAGLRVGDVIRRVGGLEVNDPQGLNYRVAIGVIGESAALDVLRRGVLLTLSIDLSVPPEDPPRNVTDVSGPNPIAGARIANLSPALAEELGLDSIAMSRGVIVLGVAPRSNANRIRLRQGDVFVRVNDRNIRTIEDLTVAIRAAREWNITVRRGNQDINFTVGG